MTKTVPILDRTILCPKCQIKTMRQSVHPQYNLEYYCDQCHCYWGINELVILFDYDLGNFGDCFPLDVYNVIGKKNNFAKNNGRHPWMNLPIMQDWDTPEEDKAWSYLTRYQPLDEPQFKSAKERDEAYEMVGRMFLDIPEYAEGCGNEGIDIGVVGVPV